MSEEMIPFVLFAVRLPGNSGWDPEYSVWKPEYTETKFEKAAEAIINKYPDALEFRIISRGSCKKSISSNNFEEMLWEWQLFSFGWYYDALEDRWLAPEEEANRPTTPVLPAAFNMNAELPKHGWWHLYLNFNPVSGNESASWPKDCLSPKTIQCEIRCSDVFDPVDDITAFINKIKNGENARVMIDEEGCFVHMSTWCPAHDSLYLRIESLLYEEDYCYDFQLEKAQFVSEFERILAEFREPGGWGKQDSCFEEDEDSEAEIAGSLVQAAEQGQAWAQNYLGVAYYLGEGVGKDHTKAVGWYRLAADQGLDEAQFNLGNAYCSGEGVEKDQSEAVKWFRLAADQGHSGAQLNLGNAYYLGEGVEKDYAEGFKWYWLAAKQGLAQAQNNLGYAYHHGLGVEKDLATGTTWYHKAAEQGNPEAQSNLGNSYYYGHGVGKNRAEAIKWYCLAADQGVTGAKLALVEIYKLDEVIKTKGISSSLSNLLDSFKKWWG